MWDCQMTIFIHISSSSCLLRVCLYSWEEDKQTNKQTKSCVYYSLRETSMSNMRKLFTQGILLLLWNKLAQISFRWSNRLTLIHISKPILSASERTDSFFAFVRLLTMMLFILISTTPRGRKISFWLYLSKCLYEYGIQIDFLGNTSVFPLWILIRFQAFSKWLWWEWWLMAQRAIALAAC